MNAWASWNPLRSNNDLFSNGRLVVFIFPLLGETYVLIFPLLTFSYTPPPLTFVGPENMITKMKKEIKGKTGGKSAQNFFLDNLFHECNNKLPKRLV